MRRLSFLFLALLVAACPGPVPDPTAPFDPCSPPEDLPVDCPVGPLAGDFEGSPDDLWSPDSGCDWADGADISRDFAVSGETSLKVSKAGCLIGSRLAAVTPVATDPQPQCPVRPYSINGSALRADERCTGASCAQVVIRWYDAGKAFLYEHQDVVGPKTAGGWESFGLSGVVDKRARFYSLRFGGPNATLAASVVYFDAASVTIPGAWSPVVNGNVPGCQ